MQAKNTMAQGHNYNEIEQECIVLHTVWSMVDDMVNFSIFDKIRDIEEAQLNYNSREGKTLFNILLAEFLSQPRGSFNLPQSAGRGNSDDTFLFYLHRICENPKLGSSIGPLRKATRRFGDWLDSECLVEKVWFPSIDVETDIKIKRMMFLKICGDYAKHNLTRLGLNVKRITGVLAENGVEIDRTQGFLVMEEFCDWFSDNQLAYHTTTIAEFLNEIRWEIYEYLRQEFSRSYQEQEDVKLNYIRYSFDVPSDCQNELARAAYWELMNKVRSTPWVPRFKTTPILQDAF